MSATQGQSIQRWYFLRGVETFASKKVPSRLDNKRVQSRKTNQSVEIVIKKCRCDSAWCPDCYRSKGAKKVAQRIRAMNPKKVRHIVLTVDRKLFKDGREAYEYVSWAKIINGMMRNLKRTKGINYEDYLYILEFHKDGFPHWHIIVERDVEGKAAMIGGDNIRHYWKIGQINEEYIRNEKHWNNFTGYYEKHGYFEEKDGHQGRLPEWALEYDRTIRKYDGMRGKNKSETSEKGQRSKEIEREIKAMEQEQPIKKRDTYEVILSKCGKNTMIEMSVMGGIAGFGMTVDYSYKKFKKLLRNKRYVEGLGLVSDVTYDDIRKICQEVKDIKLVQNVVMLDAYIHEKCIIIS